MSNLEIFESQFASIKSNCEITTYEYEEFILSKAAEIAHQHFLEEEIDSADEMLARVAEDAIKAIQQRHRPF